MVATALVAFVAGAVLALAGATAVRRRQVNPNVIRVRLVGPRYTEPAYIEADVATLSGHVMSGGRELEAFVLERRKGAWRMRLLAESYRRRWADLAEAAQRDRKNEMVRDELAALTPRWQDVHPDVAHFIEAAWQQRGAGAHGAAR